METTIEETTIIKKRMRWKELATNFSVLKDATEMITLGLLM